MAKEVKKKKDDRVLYLIAAILSWIFAILQLTHGDYFGGIAAGLVGYVLFTVRNKMIKQTDEENSKIVDVKVTTDKDKK